MSEAQDLSDLSDTIKELARAVSKQNGLLERLVLASEARTTDGASKTSTETGENKGTHDVMSRYVTAFENEKALPSEGKESKGAHEREAGVETSSQSDAQGNSDNHRDLLIRFAPKQFRLLGGERLMFYITNRVPSVWGYRELRGKDAEDLKESNLVGEFPEQGIASNQWRYWIAIEEDTFPPRLWVDSYGARPDFIPPWELCKHNGLLYHIDDASFSCPIPDAPDFRKCHSVQVPYSFIPPPGRDQRTRGIAKTGITVDWATITQGLGNLYAVPPDGRLPLSFERNALRLKCASNQIDRYLSKVQGVLERIKSFSIMDFDDKMNFAVYEFGAKTNTSEGVPPYWIAAGPALLAEGFHLSIPPVLESLKTEPDGSRSLSYVPTEIRPWHRIVRINGLAAAVDSSVGHSIDDLLGLLISDYDYGNRRRLSSNKNLVASEMFDLHVFCKRAGRNSKRKPFHITWIQIVDEDDIRTMPSWQSGPLYGSENKFLQERAFTVEYFEGTSSWSCLKEIEFGTILLLAPHMLTDDRQVTPHTMILRIISTGLQEAADAWEDIMSYFEQLFNPRDTVFEPKRHDSLLFDDVTFSRSRLYFWALDSLEMFRITIKDTKERWNEFWSDRGAKIRERNETYGSLMTRIFSEDKLESASVDSWLREIQTQIDRLEGVQAEIDKFSKGIQVLRDGLFNASSVIEARAATRLGENVKLLTYVSIFYLPLGFCAALWSINKDYGTTPFAITTVVVGVATFAVVANMENILRIIQDVYRSAKKSVVARMKQDPDEKWKKIGVAFSDFKPQRDAAKVSEWLVLWYTTIELLRKLGIISVNPKNADNGPQQWQETLSLSSISDESIHGRRWRRFPSISSISVEDQETSGNSAPQVGSSSKQENTTTSFMGRMRKFIVPNILSKERRPQDVEKTEPQDGNSD